MTFPTEFEGYLDVSVPPVMNPAPQDAGQASMSGRSVTKSSAKEFEIGKTVFSELDAKELSNGRLAYKSVIDLTKLPFCKLMMPGHYFPDTNFSAHLERYMAANQHRSRSNFCRLHMNELPKKVMAKSPQAMTAMVALEYLSDIRQLVGPLARLGLEFRDYYHQQTEKPYPETAVEDFCDVEERRYTARQTILLESKEYLNSPGALEFANQQSLRIPKRKPGEDHTDLKGSRHLQAFLREKLKAAGIEGPLCELLGFVPSKVANPKVRGSGFIDSHWSLNFLHGNETHLIQLVLLVEAGILDKDSLAYLVDHGLWGWVLDRIYVPACDGYSILDPGSEDKHMARTLEKDPNELDISLINFQGAEAALCANGPSFMHRFFLAGEFSQAIECLSNDLDAEGRVELITRVLGMNPCGSDLQNKSLLRDVARNLTALESCITHKQLKSMDNIASFMGLPSSDELFKDLSDTYSFMGKDKAEPVIREKARRHLAKGRRVLGIKPGSTKEKVLDRHSDLSKYQSFVVYRD
ncbi:hypothetical protein [Endozoicomonas numazuensis]|uniref:Uncharacterized protein n=1 Tax=Endozoicomonas numazuensis TaxID=1137799 RepID=A0A081NJ30_9GAMM|nr:hypothetical protein [Endozoicomonas numazuensis]KEQ18453.1 hypothetical protein GZ78_13265 [Endozoicomonas numazuensis]